MTGLTLDYQSDTKNEERPALSGYAMEFLKDSYDYNDKNKMEVIEEKEEENNN